MSQRCYGSFTNGRTRESSTVNSDTSASTEPALDNAESKGVRKLGVGTVRAFIDLFAVVLAIVYLWGFFAARHYYNSFGLSINDLGLTQLDLIMAALPTVLIIAGALFAFFQFGNAVRSLVERFFSTDALSQRRRSVRGLGKVSKVIIEAHIPLVRLIALGTLPVIIFLLFGHSLQDSSGTHARSTTYEMPKRTILLMVPKPRWVEFADAPHTCYALIGTHDGVWFLWDPTIPTLERHAIGQGVLKTCQNKT